MIMIMSVQYIVIIQEVAVGDKTAVGEEAKETKK